MTTNLVLALTIGLLFAAGVYLMLSRNLIRVLLGFLLAGHSINLLLLSTSEDGVPPIVGEPTNGEPVADPIPQALILTSIVISLAVSTFLLAMAYRNYKVTQEPEIEEDTEDSELSAADLGGGDE
jgi:multicomponent Na+:H+ antiporter subunit C